MLILVGCLCNVFYYHNAQIWEFHQTYAGLLELICVYPPLATNCIINDWLNKSHKIMTCHIKNLKSGLVILYQLHTSDWWFKLIFIYTCWSNQYIKLLMNSAQWYQNLYITISNIHSISVASYTVGMDNKNFMSWYIIRVVITIILQ